MQCALAAYERRRLALLVGTALGLSMLLALAAQGAGTVPPLLATVGDVTATSAIVWVRGQSWGPVDVRYGRLDDPASAQRSIRVTPATHLTGKLLLTGLRPASTYHYTVTQRGHGIRGSFVTAPSPSAPVPVRFIWSGDLGSGTSCRDIQDGYPIFRTLARFAGDFFVFAGDTIYADQACRGPDRVPGSGFVATKLPDYWAKHRYNREDADVQAYFRTTSVYAIWDDHEVRNDFSGPTEPLMPVGRRAFLDYFPIQPPPEEPGRLYRSARWGSLLELFILDTRQYRSPDAAPDSPGKTMLGPAQKRWLIDAVGGSTATWKVVVSSVPLSVPTGRAGARDSWSNANVLGFPEEGGTGFAFERDAILRAMRERGVRNLVVLAADVHHAELIRHEPASDWSLHEFIAGPLAASPGRPRPLDSALAPRSLFAMGGVENFGEISVDATGLTVRIIDIGGAVRFTYTIAPE